MSPDTAMLASVIVAAVLACIWFAFREHKLYRLLILRSLDKSLWTDASDLVKESEGVLQPYKTQMVLTELLSQGLIERSKHGPKGACLYRRKA